MIRVQIIPYEPWPRWLRGYVCGTILFIVGLCVIGGSVGQTFSRSFKYARNWIVRNGLALGGKTRERDMTDLFWN